MKNTKQPVLSIIIPVYNTMKYLRKCIDSVLNQSYKNIEVILVNDCTLDNSEDIILDYIEKDDRIRYLKNNSNKGLFATRIEGFKVSTGDYIATLDSDDTVGVDYYRLLMKDAVEKEADITASSLVVAVARDEEASLSNLTYKCRTLGDYCMRGIDLSGDEILNTFLDTECYSSHWWIGCCKVYSRKLWNRALPILEKLDTNQVMLEDLIFGVIFMSLADRYISSDSETYFYLKHPESSSMDNGDLEKFKKNIKDINNAMTFLEEYLLNLNTPSSKIKHFKNMRKIMRRTWGSMVTTSKFTVEEKEEIYILLKSVSTEESSDIPHVEDQFCYLLDTPWDKRLDELKREIQKDKYKYISFDIFDTMIVRPFFQPKDLFQLLNYKYNELIENQTFVDFADLREKAERIAREEIKRKAPQFEEITLDEIYEVLKMQFNLEESLLTQLRVHEIELEYKYCYARDKVKELYDFALACQKKVICISDMYLSKQLLEDIVIKNGYTEIEDIFVSSEYRLTKSSGALYQKVLSTLEIASNEILHVGDNWNSDIVIARNTGITASLIPKASELLENKVSDIDNKKLRGRFYDIMHTSLEGNYVNFQFGYQHFGIRCMLAVVANKYFSNPFRSYIPRTDFNKDPYYMGYFALGMLDFGIAMWLREKVTARYSKVHFVARDGYVVKRIYDTLSELYPEMPESNYLYISRKSLLPLAIKSQESFYSLERYMKLEGQTIRDILTLLEPVMTITSDVEKQYLDRGFFLDHPLNNKTTRSALLAITEISFDFSKMLAYRKIMKNYFSNIIGPNDAMYDIGYSGRSQALLSDLLGYRIDAYYMHTINDQNNLYKLQGNFEVQTFFDYTPTVIGRMRELIQSEAIGSCIGYRVEGSEIIPVFEEIKFSSLAQNVLNVMQDAAVEFAADMIHIFGDDIGKLPWRYIDSSFAHEFFLHNPTKGDRDIFRIFYFEDDMLLGTDYAKRDLATLWENDLKRNNLLPKSQKETVTVPHYVYNQPQPNSIPITSNKVDIVHLTEKQRGGYYFLFDRRRFERWLEEHCTGFFKRLFVYGTYRLMRNIRNSIKYKRVLYVATSSYHVLCCMLHKFYYNTDCECELLLSDWRESMVVQLENAGVFSKIHIMPDRYLRDVSTKMDDKFATLNNEEKEKKAQEFLQIYSENLPTDIFTYKKIIVCNDTMPIGPYLCESRTKYESIEDGNGIFADNTLLRENIERITPYLEQYLLNKHNILQRSIYATKMYANLSVPNSNQNSSSVVDFNTAELLQKCSEKTLTEILQIYGGGSNTSENGASDAGLLLTYPLAQRTGITFEEQYGIYQKIIDIFMSDKNLHIKPHPDDKGEYASCFKDARIIPKSILSELLWYETQTMYDISISTMSTSMKALKNHKEGLELSRVFIEANKQFFALFAIALFVKRARAYNNGCAVIIENIDSQELLTPFLNYKIVAEESGAIANVTKINKISIVYDSTDMKKHLITLDTESNEINKTQYLIVQIYDSNNKLKEFYRIKVIVPEGFKFHSDKIHFKNINMTMNLSLKE